MKIWVCTPGQLYHSQVYLGGGIPHFNLLLSIIWTYNSHYINFNNSHSPDLLVVLYFGLLIVWWGELKGCLSSVWAPLINDNFATIISSRKRSIFQKTIGHFLVNMRLLGSGWPKPWQNIYQLNCIRIDDTVR